MSGEEFKERLTEFWDKVKETAGNIWEEIVDRVLDWWDSYRRLKPAYQIGIAGGVGLVILVVILASVLYTPQLPVIAVQNTEGIFGGNWIAIENQSNQDLKDLYLIIDDKYIYYLENLKAGEQIKIFNRDFYHRQGDFEFGEQVGEDFVGERLWVVSPRGEKEIPLVEKKRGLFR